MLVNRMYYSLIPSPPSERLGTRLQTYTCRMHAGKLPGILRINSHCPECHVKYADCPHATKILDGT